MKPKEWRIVGHNESEGMKLRNRKQLHRAKATSIRGFLASWLGKVGVKFLESAYSQDMELEADTLGVRLVAVAGYDPHAPMQLLSRLSELSQPAKQFSLGNYFSSHPAFKLRIQNVKRLLRQ